MRGSLDPMLTAFQAAKAQWGIVAGAGAVGVVVMAAAALGLSLLEETYGKDLDYVES